MGAFEALDVTGSAWLDTLLLALAAAAAVLAAHAIAASMLRRVFRGRPVAETMLRHVSAPSAGVLVLAAFNIIIQGAPAGLPYRATAEHGASLALIIAATWLAARAIDAMSAIVVLLNPADMADNLRARAVATQARVVGRALKTFAIVLGIAAALITFPGVRQLGATLLASAGVAGLVAGLAARPLLSNIIAGMQIAITQPIRIDDVVIVEGEWGRIEEITGSYVVVKVWDERRLVVPLRWFIENPFQNWTHTGAQVIGTVFVWADYAVPVAQVREEFLRLCREAPEWDGRVAGLQVTDANERAVQLRGIASSADASRNWDLRCKLREGLVDYLQRRHPQHLPRVRARVEERESATGAAQA